MSDIWGKVLFILLAVVAIALVVLVVRDIRIGGRPSRVLVAGGVAVVLVVLGMALTLVPITASTGATCGMQPATSVLGSSGSQERVDEAAPGTDQESVQSCIDTARTRTVLASVCVLLGAGGYAIARRTRTSTLQR